MSNKFVDINTLDVNRLVVRKKDILNKPNYVKDMYSLNYIYPDNTEAEFILYLKKSKLAKWNPMMNDAICIDDNHFDKAIKDIARRYMTLIAIDLNECCKIERYTKDNMEGKNYVQRHYVRINKYAPRNSLIALGSRKEAYDNRHYSDIKNMQNDKLITDSKKMSKEFHLNIEGFIIFSCGTLSDQQLTGTASYINPLINYLEVSLNRSSVVSEIHFNKDTYTPTSMEI